MMPVRSGLGRTAVGQSCLGMQRHAALGFGPRKALAHTGEIAVTADLLPADIRAAGAVLMLAAAWLDRCEHSADHPPSWRNFIETTTIDAPRWLQRLDRVVLDELEIRYRPFERLAGHMRAVNNHETEDE